VSDQYARANAASAGMLGSCARTSLPKTPVTLPWGFTIVCPLRDGLKSSCYGRSGNQANALLKPVNALLASPGNRALFRKLYVTIAVYQGVAGSSPARGANYFEHLPPFHLP